MIKKSLIASVVGRRNKQMILKDFVRPAPASVISSPSITTSPYSGNIPGCAAPPPGSRNPCAEIAIDTSAVTGSWNSTPHGVWEYYPKPPTPPQTTDPTRFSNWYLTGGFPADELIADGPALDLWGGGRLSRKLWAYRQSARQPAPFSDEQLWYFGGAFHGGGVNLTGLSQSLTSQNPYEVLIRFSIPSAPSMNVMNGFTLGLADTTNFDSGTLSSNANVTISYNVLNTDYESGTPVPDRITVRCDGSAGPNNNSTAYEIRNLVGCGGTNLQYGQHYYLRALKDTDGVYAKLWLSTETEPSEWSRGVGRTSGNEVLSGFGVSMAGLALENCPPDATSTGGSGSWDTPCLGFADNEYDLLFSHIWINPSGAYPGDSCDESVDDSSGVYLDALLRRASYWVPASSNVSRYQQVYFDGVPVYEGTHYWLDGLKLYPQDPAIFADTLATAMVVVE